MNPSDKVAQEDIEQQVHIIEENIKKLNSSESPTLQMIPENLQDSKSPRKNKINNLISPVTLPPHRRESLEDEKDDEEEDEDMVNSDLEDMFLDALGEIQEASVKLNNSMASARSLAGVRRDQRFESFDTPVDT